MAVIPDWTLFVQMGNFILLIFLLNVILYKPIRQILIERKKKIQGYKEGIETLQQDASESQRTFQAKISEARGQGVQEKEALKQAGQEEEKRVVDEINRKAQAELEAVCAQIAKDAEDARRGLEKEIGIFSGTIAEKILGRAVS
ncbi:MAG: ATP synthase F0 subunit B [Deltaproteobacteria bacterium]|nr:ATP synthase F0 subunit B [Deltaproteobacteria bacterium]MBW1793335.1 ATP synthase F0 subunit B [Deltaproteobacteria bacterium]MBW2329927.1 ATP synthase F0 subunit B [Deltaproteobacteria bacterium]